MSKKEVRERDRQELEELWDAVTPAKNEEIARRAISMALKYLNKADNQAKQIQDLVRLRKTGTWVSVVPTKDIERCSECMYEIESGDQETPYCPVCGAKMNMMYYPQVPGITPTVIWEKEEKEDE